MSVVSTSFSTVYGVRKRISGGPIVQYDVRNIVSPAKLVSIGYDVRVRVSKSVDVLYWVRVPISSFQTFTVQYNVRQRVPTSLSIVYNATSGATIGGSFSTAFSSAFDSAVGNSSITVAVFKMFGIVYQTLVTPRIDKVIVVPIQKDSVPPQIITTSF